MVNYRTRSAVPCFMAEVTMMEFARSDGNTDIQVVGGGNTQLLFPTKGGVRWKAIAGWYGTVRAFNYFLKTAEARNEAGEIEGDDKLILNYIGEGYFFRALTYYRMLALYGDLPIVTEVLEDNNEVIVENSKRAPRNEVVRFILSDLDKAIERLYDRDHFKGQRVNKQTAALLKSRVALFEATFEKYHKGSGRVPGDANWPGARWLIIKERPLTLKQKSIFPGRGHESCHIGGRYN